MGRTNEFRVAKAFTLGMTEAAWLAEKVKKGQKASRVVNNLIRAAIAVEKKKRPEKPAKWCGDCASYQGYDLIDDKWLCEKCKSDGTDYIIELLRR
jgi:hypothetical protein